MMQVLSDIFNEIHGFLSSDFPILAILLLFNLVFIPSFIRFIKRIGSFGAEVSGEERKEKREEL